jgi:hypothetical protein
LKPEQTKGLFRVAALIRVVAIDDGGSGGGDDVMMVRVVMTTISLFQL